MKRFSVLMIAVLSVVILSACTFINNNYYGENGSSHSSETAQETQSGKDNDAASSAPAGDNSQSTQSAAPVIDNNTPFYGIWIYASKSYNEALSFADNASSKGFSSYVENTTHWSNLNDEEWYVVTVGKYSSEGEANNQLSEAKKEYPDAYVKYSGEYQTTSDSVDSSFYGIWVYASKSYDEALDFANDVSSKSFNGFVITTTDWKNLNSEKWYVVTAGKYNSEKEANNMLDSVKKYYPDAYVKYSGDHT